MTHDPAGFDSAAAATGLSVVSCGADECARVRGTSEHVDGPIIAWIGCGPYRPDLQTTPIKLIAPGREPYHFRFPSTAIAGLIAALARPEIVPTAPATGDGRTDALRAAESALALVVAEAPESDPDYPKGGTRDECEDWAMQQAYWNAAEIARPALIAVRNVLAGTAA